MNIKTCSNNKIYYQDAEFCGKVLRRTLHHLKDKELSRSRS